MGDGLVGEILAFFKFTDIFTVFFCAALLFACRCEKRPRFSLRLAGFLAVSFVLCRIFACTYGGSLTAEILYSAVLILLMLAGLMFCYRESVWNILFCFGSGFMTWYITDRSNLILVSLGRLDARLAPCLEEGTISHVLLYCATFFVVYPLVYFTVGRKMHRLRGMSIPPQNAILLMLVVSFLTPIFYFESALIAGFSLVHYTLLNLAEVVYYISMLVVQIIILNYTYEKAQYAALQALRGKEREQYQLVKENVDAINIKCHDLKYQLRHLRDSRQVDQTYLDEMEQSISIYNSAVRTGNETVDVVLTDKRLHCAANGIQFTCMVEGKDLDFMETMDIFSLFGNALDNAIESETAQEEARRFIHLSVKAAHRLLLFHMENYFEGALTFQDGLPVTTKADKDSHGYGMRSIRHIVEKYGGDLSVSAGDGLFQLDIMIPIPAASDTQ